MTIDRVGVVAGASVYPLVWNILLAARNEGFGGTITTMAVAEEPALKQLLGIPDGVSPDDPFVQKRQLQGPLAAAQQDVVAVVEHVGDGAGAVLACYGHGLLAQVGHEWDLARDRYTESHAGFAALGLDAAAPVRPVQDRLAGHVDDDLLARRAIPFGMVRSN